MPNQAKKQWPSALESKDEKLRVLFLCTGNSCRSQMAEGWTRQLKSNVIEPYSAGIQTHGLNPNAVKVMAEAGVDISRQRCKNVAELLNVSFDYVVTVCGHANETCPIFPGETKVIHVAFDDPPKLAQEAGTEEEALNHYRRVRDEIRAFVETLPKALMEVAEMKNQKKKGLLSAIRESMMKTGGCCGPGETCGGSAKKDDKERDRDNNAKGPDKTEEK
ncbi:MAG: hypothetical protein GWP14_10385 [Actinobacteria bacterium]|nr:hypothetical protein [Actinomycetota bacterium]